MYYDDHYLHGGMTDETTFTFLFFSMAICSCLESALLKFITPEFEALSIVWRRCMPFHICIDILNAD